MKRTLDRPKVSPSFSPKTVTWVGGAHLLVLLALALFPLFNRPKPKEKMLQIVELGSLNPGQGTITGSENGKPSGGSPAAPKNSIAAPPPPLPPQKAEPKPQIKPVQEIKEPEPVKEEAKVEPEPVKVPPKVEKTEPPVEKIEPKIVKPVAEVKKPEPKETKTVEVKTPKAKEEPAKTKVDVKKEEVKKPAKTPVKVDLGKPIKRSVAGTPAPNKSEKGEESGKEGGVQGGTKEGVKGGVKGSTGTNAKAETKGPSASDLRNQLSTAVGAIGVEKGSGQGAAGSPDGSAYHALIKRTLTGNWVKPGASGGSLEAKVRIRIKPDGSVEALGIFASSGDKAMDQSVLDAVRSTGKLSKPLPEGMGSPDYEVVVNFQLD